MTVQFFFGHSQVTWHSLITVLRYKWSNILTQFLIGKVFQKGSGCVYYFQNRINCFKSKFKWVKHTVDSSFNFQVREAFSCTNKSNDDVTIFRYFFLSQLLIWFIVIFLFLFLNKNNSLKWLNRKHKSIWHLVQMSPCKNWGWRRWKSFILC